MADTQVGHYNHTISNKKADTQVPPLLLHLHFYSITVHQSRRDGIFVARGNNPVMDEQPTSKTPYGVASLEGGNDK